MYGIFDKVKAALIAAVVAAIVAIAALPVDNWSWKSVLAVALTAAAPVLAAYLKTERNGYGIAPLKPEDTIPGGQPLPTGAHEGELP